MRADMADFLSAEHALHIGGEPFQDAGGGATAGDFWRWAFSDILMDTLRGSFAEFLVARLIGETGHPPPDTTACDILTSAETRVEVKSTAFVQRWTTPRKNPALSFSGLKRKPYNYDTGVYGVESYLADVYVFCLLAEKDRTKIDVFDLTQWEFYVVTQGDLERITRNRSSVSLASLRSHVKPCPVERLSSEVSQPSPAS